MDQTVARLSSWTNKAKRFSPSHSKMPSATERKVKRVQATAVGPDWARATQQSSLAPVPALPGAIRGIRRLLQPSASSKGSKSEIGQALLRGRAARPRRNGRCANQTGARSARSIGGAVPTGTRMSGWADGFTGLANEQYTDYF